MGVRIQELPETTGINKEDVLIVEDGQGTKKGTVQQLDEALGVSQLKEDLANEVTGRENAIANNVEHFNLEINNTSNRLENLIANEKNRAISEELRIESLFTTPTIQAVNDWLNSHPEATTSVLDESITESKLNRALYNSLNNGYVMAEEYYQTSDNGDWGYAIQRALESGKPVYLSNKTYNVGHTINMPIGSVLIGNNAVISTSDFGIPIFERNELGELLSDNSRYALVCTGSNSVIGIKFKCMSACVRCIGDNFTIRDCYFKTYTSMQSGVTGYYGIELKNATNVTIDNIYIDMEEGNNRDGIHIDGNCNTIRISNSYIISGDDAIAFNAVEEHYGEIYDVFVSNCVLLGYCIRFFSKGESTKISHIKFSNCKIYGTKWSGIRFLDGWGINDDTGNIGVYEDISFDNCNIDVNGDEYYGVYVANANADIKFSNCNIKSVYLARNIENSKISFDNVILLEDISLKNITQASVISFSNSRLGDIKYNNNLFLFITSCIINSITVDSKSINSYTKIVNSVFITQAQYLRGECEYTIIGCRFNGESTPIRNENGTFILSDNNNYTGSIILSGSTAKRITGNGLIDSYPSSPQQGDMVFNYNVGKYAYWTYSDGWKWIVVG